MFSERPKIEKDPSSTSSISEDESVDEPPTTSKKPPKSHGAHISNGYSQSKKAKSQQRSQCGRFNTKHGLLHPAKDHAKTMSRLWSSDSDLHLPEQFKGKTLPNSPVTSNLAKEGAVPFLSKAKAISVEFSNPFLSPTNNQNSSRTDKNRKEKEEPQSISDVFKSHMKNLFGSSMNKEERKEQISQKETFTKDIEYQKLIKYIMQEEADYFAKTKLILEHSTSESEIDEVFAVREFPQSSQPLPKARSLDYSSLPVNTEGVNGCDMLEKNASTNGATVSWLPGNIDGANPNVIHCSHNSNSVISSPNIPAQECVSGVFSSPQNPLISSHRKPIHQTESLPTNHSNKSGFLNRNSKSLDEPCMNRKSSSQKISHSKGLFLQGGTREDRFSNGDEESSDTSLGIEGGQSSELETSPEEEVIHRSGNKYDREISGVNNKNGNTCANTVCEKDSSQVHISSTLENRPHRPSLLKTDHAGSGDFSLPRGSDSDGEEWARKTAEVIEVIQNQVMRNKAIDVDDPVLHGRSCHRRLARLCNGRRHIAHTNSPSGSNGSDTDSSLTRPQTTETWSISSDGFSESVSDFDDVEALVTVDQSQSENTYINGHIKSHEKDNISEKKENLNDSSPGSDDVFQAEEPTYHRYYHVFRQGELVELIDKYVDCLHILQGYYDHANWCVVAEKVQVWTL